ncbi:MAG: hypothetical protein KDA44_12200 [Planctomycetales bacterium]|nr:hypothetical protein [Planctomycetales bacterium]
MSADPREPDAWEACPAGSLRQIAARQTATAQSAAWRRSTLGALASVLVAVGVVVTAGLASGKAPAQIKCKDCHERFTEFRDHVTGNHEMADPRIVEGMKRHLKKCGGCRKRFQKQFPGCPLGKKSSCRPRSSCGEKKELSVQRDCPSHDKCGA